MKKNKINFSRLKELFSPNFETGELFRRVTTCSVARSGDLAGTIDTNGYRKVWIDGRYYPYHWIIFSLYEGNALAGLVDHKDGNRSNNKISNLREATYSENNCNAKISKRNKTGTKGLRWREKIQKWEACIICNKKYIHLGTFSIDEKDLAIQAIKEARIKYHGEFANHG